jgi:hypothetical protein
MPTASAAPARIATTAWTAVRAAPTTLVDVATTAPSGA